MNFTVLLESVDVHRLMLFARSFLSFLPSFSSSDFTVLRLPITAQLRSNHQEVKNRTAGTKVNIKQDADAEFWLFLNQPGLIHHFNLYRGKMDEPHILYVH